jgi:hypothetical protein
MRWKRSSNRFMILPDIGEIEKPGEGDESGAVGET